MQLGCAIGCLADTGGIGAQAGNESIHAVQLRLQGRNLLIASLCRGNGGLNLALHIFGLKVLLHQSFHLFLNGGINLSLHFVRCHLLLHSGRNLLFLFSSYLTSLHSLLIIFCGHVQAHSLQHGFQHLGFHHRFYCFTNGAFLCLHSLFHLGTSLLGSRCTEGVRVQGIQNGLQSFCVVFLGQLRQSNACLIQSGRSQLLVGSCKHGIEELACCCIQGIIVGGQGGQAIFQRGNAFRQLISAILQCLSTSHQLGHAVIQLRQGIGHSLPIPVHFRQILAFGQSRQQRDSLILQLRQILYVIPHLAAQHVDGLGSSQGHHPADFRMVSLRLHGEVIRKLQLFVKAWHGIANHYLTAAFREEHGVFHFNVRNAIFRQGQNADSHIGRIGCVGNGQFHFTADVLQGVGRNFFPVHLDRHNRLHGNFLVALALIGNVVSGSLPGKGLAIQGESLMASHVFHAGQARTVGNGIQGILILDMHVVNHRGLGACCIHHGENPLTLYGFCAGTAGCYHHGPSQCQGDQLLLHDQFRSFHSSP